MYKLYFIKQAQKDAKNIKAAGFKSKVQNLLELVSVDPYATYPCYEKLIGDLKGLYSRRITIQHRLIYQVDEDAKLIKVIRMWTHYQ